MTEGHEQGQDIVAGAPGANVRGKDVDLIQLAQQAIDGAAGSSASKDVEVLRTLDFGPFDIGTVHTSPLSGRAMWSVHGRAAGRVRVPNDVMVRIAVDDHAEAHHVTSALTGLAADDVDAIRIADQTIVRDCWHEVIRLAPKRVDCCGAELTARMVDVLVDAVPDLKELDACHARWESIPESVFRCEQLEILEIGHTQLELCRLGDLAKDLPNLRVLGLEGVEHCCEAHKWDFNWSKAHFMGAPQPGPSTLEQVTIQGSKCDEPGDHELMKLLVRGAIGMDVGDVGGGELLDAALAGRPEVVYLTDRPVTDLCAAMQGADLSRLRELHAGRVRLTPKLAAFLVEHAPALEALTIGTAAGELDLSALAKLHSISFRVTGPGLSLVLPSSIQDVALHARIESERSPAPEVIESLPTLTALTLETSDDYDSCMCAAEALAQAAIRHAGSLRNLGFHVYPREDDVVDEDDFVPDGLWNDALEDLLNLAPHLETLELVFIGERVAGFTIENGLGVSTKLRSVHLVGLEMPQDPCAYPSVRELTIGMVDLDPDLYPVSAAEIARAFPTLRSLHLGTLELHAVDGLDDLIDLRWLTANDAYTVDGSPIPDLTQARLRTRAEHPIWDAVAE